MLGVAFHLFLLMQKVAPIAVFLILFVENMKAADCYVLTVSSAFLCDC